MKFPRDILPTVGALAPNLATALGGPVAGWAVGELEKVFGFDPGTAQADNGAQLAKAIAGMTPDQAVALRKADQDFSIRMRELDIDLDKLSQEDRASARQMQIQTRDLTPRLLALLIVIGFFTLLGLMAFVQLPVKNESAIQIMLGSLAAAFGAVYQFFFGSSAGSQAKDQTIRELTK